ncbi:MAG: hypothetical protein M9952_14285 [Microthrixaceae bacterium]|nr:hypothetical protein [Microthrixaceae bacterium]
MTGRRVVLASLSAAMDGGFTAVADVSSAMAATGMAEHHRLIGGVAVMLHVQRLGLDLPLRATGDADFGVPPHLLRGPELVAAIEALGYRKVAGNRWERPVDDRRVASVDLLIPTYRSRSRGTVRVGSIVTSEVPGLAEAFQRPAVNVGIDLRLTDGETLSTTVSLPDAVGMLALKALVRTVRTEDRDVEDLWRCLEVAAAEGVEPATFESSKPLEEVRAALWRELGPNGTALNALTTGLQADPAARLRTRLRALLTETVGPTPA